MKIKNVKVSTSSGEKIKFNNVEFIGFGIMESSTFKESKKELSILCERGYLRFPLDDVNDVEFILEREEFDVCVHSHINKEDE